MATVIGKHYMEIIRNHFEQYTNQIQILCVCFFLIELKIQKAESQKLETDFETNII